MLIAKKRGTIFFVLVMTIMVATQTSANTLVDSPNFNQVELLSISLKPTVLVIRDQLDDTQTIRLAPGAKITSNGKVVDVEQLAVGDVLYIATKEVISNIIVSNKSPSEAERALHKIKPKLIEVTVDKDKLEQSAKQFYLTVILLLIGLVVFILILITQTKKKNSAADEVKKNRRSI